MDLKHLFGEVELEGHYSEMPADEPAPRVGMVKVEVPFCGLYESVISACLDNTLERETEYIYDELRAGNTEVLDNMNIPYVLDVRKACGVWIDNLVEYIEENTDMKFELAFAELYHPREYNFETDKLFCWMKKSDIKKLLNYIESSEKRVETLNELVHDACTSRDGYIPYYKEDDFQPLNEGCPACFYEFMFEAALPFNCESEIGVRWYDVFEL